MSRSPLETTSSPGTPRPRRIVPILFLLTVGLVACPKTPKVEHVRFDPKRQCFSAVADGAQPAQAVFDRKGRSGNGETWLALLLSALTSRATLGDGIDVPEMGFGYQQEVTVDG